MSDGGGKSCLVQGNCANKNSRPKMTLLLRLLWVKKRSSATTYNPIRFFDKSIQNRASGIQAMISASDYWNVNVPKEDQTADCPDFLKGVDASDQKILSTSDADYRFIAWSEVKEIISDGRIGDFKRKPSNLRRYFAFLRDVRRQYGSVMNFVLTQRLNWTEPIVAGGLPFADPSDLKILYNDWPYGLEAGIVHLVVWTKFDLPDDPLSGELADATRKMIDQYVTETFCAHIPTDQVIWFKNTVALKSVHCVEHFHVMINNPDPDFVARITNNDVPLSLQ